MSTFPASAPISATTPNALRYAAFRAVCCWVVSKSGFNLADFACEEALYDITNLRHFAGIDLGCEAVPDALLEKHNLNEQLFAEVGRVLQGGGMTFKTGMIVDATIDAEPPFAPCGCFALAWSVAEVLCAWLNLHHSAHNRFMTASIGKEKST